MWHLWSQFRLLNTYFKVDIFVRLLSEHFANNSALPKQRQKNIHYHHVADTSRNLSKILKAARGGQTLTSWLKTLEHIFSLSRTLGLSAVWNGEREHFWGRTHSLCGFQCWDKTIVPLKDALIYLCLFLCLPSPLPPALTVEGQGLICLFFPCVTDALSFPFHGPGRSHSGNH